MRDDSIMRFFCKWLIRAIVVMGTLLTIGCREASEGDYVRLAGKVFIFNYRIATANYMVTLQRLKPLPAGAHLIATFENPAKGKPLVVASKIWPGGGVIAIESTQVSCIKKGVHYSFSVEIFFEENLIQLIEGSMTSTLDQTVLPDRPLVIGPGYERNPTLGNDGRELGNPVKSDACQN